MPHVTQVRRHAATRHRVDIISIRGDVIQYLREVPDAVWRQVYFVKIARVQWRRHGGADPFHDLNTSSYRGTHTITIPVVMPQLPELFKFQWSEEDVSKGTISVAFVPAAGHNAQSYHVVCSSMELIVYQIEPRKTSSIPAEKERDALMPGKTNLHCNYRCLDIVRIKMAAVKWCLEHMNDPTLVATCLPSRIASPRTPKPRPPTEQTSGWAR